MRMLQLEHPEIAELVTPASEYEAMKKKMLFNTKYGLVSVNPDNLIYGHTPTIRTAVNRKEYFKNQLLFLYDNKYDFKIDSTDRHKGRVTLICPTHGKQSVDSDGYFQEQDVHVVINSRKNLIHFIQLNYQVVKKNSTNQESLTLIIRVK